MPKVTFFPRNKTVDAAAGLTILEVAEDNNIDLEHACGGCCACSTCAIDAIGGTIKNLSPMDKDEEETLATLCSDRQPLTRLGCQAKITGDVKVWVKGEI